MFETIGPIQIAKTLKETEVFEDVLNNVSSEADLSPRLMKTARKGKKQGNRENSQPIKIQPKKSKSVSSKYEGFHMEY